MYQEEHLVQSFEERLWRMLSAHGELDFIKSFLKTYPKAGLYLVGGAVRDALLGRRMREMDFDFVVAHVPADELEAWFRTRGEINLVGQHFGVYKFMPTGFSHKEIPFIDIALPRTERAADGGFGGYKDFSVQTNPDLPIGDDLSRRDFTINAMAFDVRAKIIVDPFNGHKDLEQKVIRAVGDPYQRFTEDLSRILRAIRLAAELEFIIEEQTSVAMKDLLPKIRAKKKVNGKLEYVVPRETVGMELSKALSRNPARAIRELDAQGALAELFPHVHKRIIEDASYLKPLFETIPGELTIVITLMLRGLKKTDIRGTLCFTGLDTLERATPQRTEINQITSLIELLQKNFNPSSIASMRGSEFEHAFLNGKGRLFLRCLDLLNQKELGLAIRSRWQQIETRWLVDHDETIAPLLSGQDILAHGVVPGPQVRFWLERVRDLQLDGKLMRREKALSWLKENMSRVQSKPIG